MAFTFGAGSITDAYLTAFIIFDIGIAINGAIITGTHSYLSSHKNESLFTNWMVRYSHFILLILCLVLLALIPLIIFLVDISFIYPLPMKHIIGWSLILLMFSTLFFIESGILSAILQTRGRISAPGGLIVFTNTGAIVSLLICSELIGILSIPVGLLFGAILFYTYQIYLVRSKHNKFITNEKPSFSPWLSSVGLIFAIQFLPSIVAIVERIFILPFDDGILSYYIYAGRILLLPVTIIGYALSLSLISLQTKFIAESNITDFNKLSYNGILLAAFISGFLAAIFILIPEPIVKIVYERGLFEPSYTKSTASILRVISLCLFPFLLLPIFSNIFYSLGLTKKLLVIGITSTIINIVMIVILVPILRNAEALGISAIIAGWCNLFLMVYYLERNKKFTFPRDLIKKLAVIVLTSFALAFFGLVAINETRLAEQYKYCSTSNNILYLLFCTAFTCILYIGIIQIFLRKDIKESFGSIVNSIRSKYLKQ